MNLSELTTLRVGGPIEAFVEGPLTEVIPTVDNDILVLGGGSNVLAADSGFAGTVVCDTDQAIVELEGTSLRVAAGVVWDDLVSHSLELGLSGLEALSGIPGSVGAAPVQNIGAYGAEVADTLIAVRVWDRELRDFVTLTRADLGLGYRDSNLKRSSRSGRWGPTGRWVVVSVDFSLTRRKSAPIRYAELARSLGVETGEQVEPWLVRESVLDLRRSKGMVLDSADHDTWSAGSFFTNPVVAEAPVGAPAFPFRDGVKTSAAWLIDHAGFGKGFAVGPRASLSTKHPLALTNRGGASAEDILTLARIVRDGVKDTFGIELMPEPVFVGCSL